jgi:phosphopantetheinyl transferase
MPWHSALQYLRVGPIHKRFQLNSRPDSAPGVMAIAAVARMDGANNDRSAARAACDALLVELARSHSGRGGWTIQHRTDAAPVLFLDSERSELAASIAHSGSWVAAGLADGADIGVDIQNHHSSTRAQEIARFLNLQNGASGSAFFDAWVLRESIAKATRGSVLSRHAIEPDLVPACRRHGETVSAGDFQALVERVSPTVSFAVVVDHRQVMKHCA